MINLLNILLRLSWNPLNLGVLLLFFIFLLVVNWAIMDVLVLFELVDNLWLILVVFAFINIFRRWLTILLYNNIFVFNRFFNFISCHLFTSSGSTSVVLETSSWWLNHVELQSFLDIIDCKYNRGSNWSIICINCAHLKFHCNSIS